MPPEVLSGMIYAGAALMVFNIYRYIVFERSIMADDSWGRERYMFILPIVLLVMFFVGYLAVAIFGQPDLVISLILLGGSMFVLAMILFLQVVTRRIKDRESLKAELQAAEQSNRAKSEFLSTMSHEMRTPLNAIIGLNALILKDPDLTPDLREKEERVKSSAEHLLLLISDVLDMSRIEAGQLTIANEAFSLRNLLDRVNAIIGGQCISKGLAYEPDVADDVCACYIGDETKLRQVLINILGNAVKFTDEGGTISFAVERTPASTERHALRFTIADMGIGIDEGYLPHIFSAFSQEDGSATNRFGGTGLGMAITKSIVDAMGGDIQVESTKGEGTTFVVSIELEPCEDVDIDEGAGKDDIAAVSDDGAGGEVSLEGLHVLIVEDVQINADILVDLLDLEGMTSDHAENGQVAVDMFSKSDVGSYHAVLMDMRMPVMDGLAATRAIRALDRADAATVPIIALTANAFEDDIQQSLQAGANAHLTKPVAPDTLYETIARLVR